MKNVLIINGHPNTETLNDALHEAYKKGALSAGVNVAEIKVAQLNFKVNLEFGYQKRTELEPDLIQAQKQLKEADHLVFIYPVWWGAYPAILKGFLDRVFLPGFAFKKKTDSVWWDKYFKGKTAQMISTVDQPVWYYKWFNKEPSTIAMKKLTLNFIGINKVKTCTLGSILHSSDKLREKWLLKVEKLGANI